MKKVHKYTFRVLVHSVIVTMNIAYPVAQFPFAFTLHSKFVEEHPRFSHVLLGFAPLRGQNTKTLRCISYIALHHIALHANTYFRYIL